MPRTQGGESVLSRAVRIVEAFGPGDTSLTITEIARRSGLHIATASRLVEELSRFGWLQRDEDRRVRIGVRMWEAQPCRRRFPGTARKSRRPAVPVAGR
ncbi:helix-turn-helix domain-containing protein [Arthrobacter sp. NPDC093128]|uniref:helix-turn-helix domain-containing protein n=1 Tax=Arthrobacter sp. NPDC093128 TaxID=3154979 RepID=UPI00342913B5